MTHCAETARTPDEQQLVDVAAILASGIERLRERAMQALTPLQNLPESS